MIGENCSSGNNAALLLSVIDSIGKGILVFNGKVIYCNSAAEKALGYPAGSLEGKDPSEIFPVDSKLLSSCLFEEIYDCEMGGEFNFQTASGALAALKSEIRSIDFEGRSACMVTFDVSSPADKQVKKLAETEQLFRILTENSFAGIYIYKDKYIYANPEYLSKTGYSMDELKQMSPWELVHEDDRRFVKENVLRRLAGEVFDQKYHERKIITKSGEIRTVRVATNTVMIDGEFAGIGSTIDISDLKQLQDGLEEKVREETLKRYEQEQLLVQQSKLAEMGAMLRSIAHQWKQPLSAVGMLLQDMTRTFSSGGLDKEYIDWVHDTASEQISYMTETVRDFMDFLRPSKERSLFTIEDALWPTLKIFSHQAISHELSIEMKCGLKRDASEEMSVRIKSVSSSNIFVDCENCGRNDVYVEGYRNEFMQVLLNIFNNAKDAIASAKKQGTLTESGRITVRLADLEGRISIDIEDNGGGIPEELIKKIFDPYFTTKSSEQGSGIGLYMVRAIVENNMGGEVRVRNGKAGAVFSIILDRHMKSTSAAGSC
ncbi:PAS domain S-box protein [Geovibrio thiophilus]|uniref:histidine kinase n=1 Tax=Geovibrio thiophilus TaxID=139438 RepID=A0A3R5UZB9_9BACT|nr:PAS domain S-box protein [Geovibrio thiophilus]QAR34156.1 PAS domain S-box protein [Geovibrio thiophilus]